MLKKCSRRILLVVLALSLLLLTGCVARPMTVPLVLAQTRAALNRQNGVTACVLLEGKGEVSYSGMDFSLPLKIKMDTEMTFDPRVIHMKGTAGSSVLGVDLDLPVEYYISSTPADYTLCSRVEESAWYKTVFARENEELQTLPTLNAGTLTEAALYENTTLCEGKECRRIDLTLNADQIKELLGDAAKLDAVSEGMNDDLRLRASLYLDKETKLPVKLSASAENTVHLMEYALRDVKLEIVFSDWGTPGEITIPEEALSAPEQAMPPQSVIGGILP